MAAVDLKAETILESVRVSLAAISTSGDYWFTAATVIRRHLPEDQVGGKTLPLFSVQGGALQDTGEGQEHGLGMGSGASYSVSFSFTTRGYAKSGSIDSDDNDTDAYRLIKDMTKAIMTTPGFGCNATQTQVVRAVSLVDSARPGFIGAECEFTTVIAEVWNV